MYTTKVLTLTMNPAIDKSTMTTQIIPEAKLRCSASLSEPGGGGINVSKALKKLGTDSLAVFPAGGHNGNKLLDLLHLEHISVRPLQVKQETRENFMVLENATGKQYRFNMPGHPLDEKIADEILETIKTLKIAPELIIASGSLPEGIHENFYADIAKLAKAKNAKLILDTSGIPLQKAANEGVYLLKPNLNELALLTGKENLTGDDIYTAALSIINNGNCEVIVVSLGADGAWLITKDINLKIAAPKVKSLSTVGAGDSMVAGMAWKILEGKSLTEMVQFGVACGSAATMNAGSALFHVEDAQRLFGIICKQ